jgi:hypothetical protein
VKYGNYGAGRTSWRPFSVPIIKNSSSDGSFGDGLAKNKFGTEMLGFLSPKTSLNLCYDLMNVSWSNGFSPWGVVQRRRQSAAVVLLVIEKTGSQVFLLSSTPLMPPYIVKMTWSRPKMPCPWRISFLFGS